MERYYKYIFDNAYRSIDVCDKNGLIIDMNKASEKLWKIDKHDFIKKQNFFELERVKNDINFLNTIQKAIRNKSTLNIECYLTHDNSGKVKWVSTIIHPIVSENGEVDLFIIINDDLTHKKKIIEEKEALYQDLLYKNYIFESLVSISKVLLECNDPTSLNQVLQIIGETLEVSRTYIFETSPLQNNDYSLDCKFEWTDKNIKPTINKMHDVILSDLKLNRLKEILLNKQIINIKNINKELYIEELLLFEPQDIKSILILPIYLPNKQLYGFIGFDECINYREWKDSEINILKNISNLVGSFIKKCYYEKRLNKFINDQNIILNNLDSYIWFFRDVNTYGFINEKYYAEFVERQDLTHTSTYKDDCLLDDCHIVEESEIQKSTNRHVFNTKQTIVYKQWLTNRSNDRRLLNIKKILVEDDSNTYIVCIADDITERYYLEKEMMLSFKTIFEEKTQIIDKNFNQIKQTLDESKEIINNHMTKIS